MVEYLSPRGRFNLLGLRKWLHQALQLLIPIVILLCASPASAEQCDPSTDTCVSQTNVRYAPWAGEYCLSGRYPQYLPMDCGGGGTGYINFATEEEAVQWRMGYEQAWHDVNGRVACGPVTMTATSEWPASPPTLGNPQGRNYKSSYPQPGAPQGGVPSCQTPGFLVGSWGVARYFFSTPCMSGYVLANSTVDNSPVCKKVTPVEPQSCQKDGGSIGSPIVPATGEKIRSELDFSDNGPGELTFSRTYRSGWGIDPSRVWGSMGKVWVHNHSANLQISSGSALMTSAEGYARTFARDSATGTWSATNSADTLGQLGSAWEYRRRDDDMTLKFDTSGKLVSTTARNGWRACPEFCVRGIA